MNLDILNVQTTLFLGDLMFATVKFVLVLVCQRHRIRVSILVAMGYEVWMKITCLRSVGSPAKDFD